MAGSHCTCPRDGSAYCAWCQGLAARAGVTLWSGLGASRMPQRDDMPEGTLQGKIQSLCLQTGHLYYHPFNSKRSTPGWPDCAIIHPEGGPLYLWELKDATGQVSPAQRRWLDALTRATTVQAGVYRPADWPRITHLLTQRRR